MPVREGAGDGDKLGYLPVFEAVDPINPEWSGQEATAFSDNWSIGVSFYHNVFAREHNTYVDAFRKQAALLPNGDSGLRNPANPDQVIRYRDSRRTSCSNRPAGCRGRDCQNPHDRMDYATALQRAVESGHERQLERSLCEAGSGGGCAEGSRAPAWRPEDAKKANSLYAAFAGGPGIFGLGNRVYEGVPLVGLINPNKEDRWDLKNDDHINGGINHFGSPFNFPEEFITVYRLHPIAARPDRIP